MRVTSDTVTDIPHSTRLRIRVKNRKGSEEQYFGVISGYERINPVSWSIWVQSDGLEERFDSKEWEGLYLGDQRTLALRSKAAPDATEPFPREGSLYHVISDIECLHDRMCLLSFENHYICVNKNHNEGVTFGWYVLTPRAGAGIPIKVDSEYVDLKVVPRTGKTPYLYAMRKEQSR